MNNNDSTNIINNCTFNKNKVGDYGVIYLEKGILSIMNSIFGNNAKVICTNVPNDYDGSQRKLTIKGSIFENNSKFVLDNNANCVIDSCTFRNNSGLIEDYYALTIKNSNFLNNKAALNIWVYNTVNLINLTFTNSNNNVTAVYSENSNLKVTNCTFKSNIEAAIISGNKVSITKGNRTTNYTKVLSFTNDLKSFYFVKYSPVKFITTYQSGKAYNVKAILGSNGKSCANVKLVLTVNLVKYECDDFFATTNSKRIASFKLSRLKVGKKKKKKAGTIVYAPYVTAKAKRSNYFKVTVKNSASKKVVPNLKIKLKVYTGKKYRIYTVKTNKKGIASFNTKNLKRGKHTVVISSGNSNYIISKRSRITIK